MNTEFEEALMGLDLGNSPPETSTKNEVPFFENKLKKQLYIVKRRIIATNDIVGKYRDNKLLLNSKETMLSNLKIDHRKLLEESQETYQKYSSLREKYATQEEVQAMLKTKNAQLELKAETLESDKKANLSFIQQLQEQCKARDGAVESMKLEINCLKDNSVGHQRKLAKKDSIITAITKNLSNVADVVFTKRTLTRKEKLILCKYMRMKRLFKEKKNRQRICELMEEEPTSEDIAACDDFLSESEDNVGEDVVNSSTIEDNDLDIAVSEDTGRGSSLKIVNSSTIEDNDSDSAVTEDTGRGSSSKIVYSSAIEDNDSDFAVTEDIVRGSSPKIVNSSTIEDNDSDIAVSEDTGRGSSLASSDKDFLSPAYSICSPSSSVESAKNKTNDADTQTQACLLEKPITVTKEIATSPIRLESSEYKKTATKEIATSPIKFKSSGQEKSATPKILIDRSTSPDIPNIIVTVDEPVNAFESLTSTNISKHLDGIEPLPLVADKQGTVKYSHLCDENINDEEIEMILENMRVGRELITPIPATPARSISRSTVISRVNNQTETTKTSEDVIELRSTVDKLTTDLKTIENTVVELKKTIETRDNKIDELVGSLLNRYEKQNEKYNENSSLKRRKKSKNRFKNTLQKVKKIKISKSNKRIVEKSNNIQEKEPDKELDDCGLFNEDPNICNRSYNSENLEQLLNEDPIILNRSYSSEKESNQEQLLLSPILKLSQRLPLQDKLSLREEPDENDGIDTSENVEQSPNKQDKKISKVKKLTKLDKFKKQCLRKGKGKIKSYDKPLTRKSGLRSIAPITQKNKSPAVSLTNNEKAAKIMAEIRSKENDSKMINKTKDHLENCYKRNRTSSGELLQSQIRKKVNVDDSENKGNKKSRVPTSDGHDNKRDKSVSLLKKDEPENSKTSVELHHSQIERVQTRSSRLSTESSDSVPLAELALSPTKYIRHRKTSEFDNLNISNLSKYPNLTFDKKLSVNVNRKEIKEIENTALDLGNGFRRLSEDAVEEQNTRKLRKRPSTDKRDAEIMPKSPSANKVEPSPPKRIHRRLNQSSLEDKFNKEALNTYKRKQNDRKLINRNRREETNRLARIINYTDLDIFSDEPAPKRQRLLDEPAPKKQQLQNELRKINEKNNILNSDKSILCEMIQKYGVKSTKCYPPKIAESVVTLVHAKIEKGISCINELPLNSNKNQEMDMLVEVLKQVNYKHFLSGLMKYLADPQRKIELYNKITTPPAPPSTKSEQVLLYLIKNLKGAWPKVDIVNQVLECIEYHLFKLNGTPDFDVIDSMAHFFALLCRFNRLRSRVKLFMVNAMYCINFKAIPIIKQCLEVWMTVLPLAHLGTAKSPLVMCIVYLLHYYKTEDDRYNRVQEMRKILSHKYFYKVSDWNENKILEMFKHAIVDLKDSPREEKMMLKLALIILAKRQGPRWCHTKLITNLLLPLIDHANTSEIARTFCVSLLGPLVKPFPEDMAGNCDALFKKLLNMLNTNPSPAMAEAVVVSLISMNRHDPGSVTRALLHWHPANVSPDLEILLKHYVRERRLDNWRFVLKQQHLAEFAITS